MLFTNVKVQFVLRNAYTGVYVNEVSASFWVTELQSCRMTELQSCRVTELHCCMGVTATMNE